MKIVFIILYYGKFPDYFELFLKSCENNPEYDWFIFSDIHSSYKFPGNVQYIDMSFKTLKKLIQKRLEIPITLNTPYKLCDYKPAYGYIFQDYIEKYDYWGYTDLDLLFGDLKRFIPYEKIKNYDKIGYLGHLTLYRNNLEISKLFMEEINGICRYKDVFQTDNVCVFDEWNWISINHIFLMKQKKVWMFDNYFDIYPHDDNFRRVVRRIPKGKNSYGNDIIEKEISFATVEDGRAYQWQYDNGRFNKKEIAYIHFQKRSMEMQVKTLDNKILCVPEKFISMEYNHIPNRYIRKSMIHKIVNKKRIKWQMKKIFYWFIVKTSRFRHPFRKKRNHK